MDLAVSLRALILLLILQPRGSNYKLKMQQFLLNSVLIQLPKVLSRRFWLVVVFKLVQPSHSLHRANWLDFHGHMGA